MFGRRLFRLGTMAMAFAALVSVSTAAEAGSKKHADDAESATPGSLSEDDRVLIVTRARLELSRVTKYTGQWMATSGYPMGDIPANRGACTDLVVRSLRAAGVDLQRLVHEDIESDPAAYGISRPDPQIDHRRATILLTYFKRHTISLPTKIGDGSGFLPGDVVFFGGASKAHVAVVSDRKNGTGVPLIIENGGPLPDETEALASKVVIGHFRVGRSALNASFKVSVPKAAKETKPADDDDTDTVEKAFKPEKSATPARSEKAEKPSKTEKKRSEPKAAKPEKAAAPEKPAKPGSKKTTAPQGVIADLLG